MSSSEGNPETEARSPMSSATATTATPTAESGEIGSSASARISSMVSTHLDPPLTLHDCLSLGEVQRGLRQHQRHGGGGSGSSTTATATTTARATTTTTTTTTTAAEEVLRENQEIQRLPILLRLLSMTRPLVAPDFFLQPHKEIQEEQVEDKASSQQQQQHDPLVSQTVEGLEYVAAIHSMAEGIDVVTNHLAPTMTRKLSRVPPLQRRRHDPQQWDTAALTAVARNPKGSVSASAASSQGKKSRKRARGKEDGVAVDATTGIENDEGMAVDDESDGFLEEENDTEEERMEVNDTFGTATPPIPKRSRNDFQRRNYMDVVAEDSQESTFVKTLAELALLVVNSLEPIASQSHSDGHADGDDDHHHHSNEDAGTMGCGGKGQLALTLDDSILAESGRDGGSFGSVEGSDLGSTVAAIVHHAPVLRSRHVANALCRASIPQMANLMTRLGANCPASVASLLLGCIEAYSLAISLQQQQHPRHSIVQVAKQGVLALAKLSPREHGRVLQTLASHGIMWDIQLELALSTRADSVGKEENESSATIMINPIAAATLLTSQLSSPHCSSQSNPRGSLERSIGASGGSSSRSLSREQSSGEEPSDYKASPHNDDDDDDDDEGHAKQHHYEPSLQQSLLEKPRLYQQALDYFVTQFTAMAQRSRVPRGQVVLLLKAYAWLLLAPCKTTPKFDRTQVLLTTLVPALQSLIEKCAELALGIGNDESSDKGIPDTSSIDRLLEALQSAVLLSSARILQPIKNNNVNETTKETCQELSSRLGELRVTSHRMEGFRYQMAAAIAQNCPPVVYAQVVQALLVSPTTVDTSSIMRDYLVDMKSGFQAVCTLLQPLAQATVDGRDSNIKTALRDLPSTLSSLLLRMEPNNQKKEEVPSSAIKEILRSILTDDTLHVSSHIITRDQLMAEFVSKATVFLSSSESLPIPLVLVTQLEQQGWKLDRNQGRPVPNEIGCKFLLQLLHALEYLETQPKSPFAIDPRSLPLKEALRLSEELVASNSSTNDFLKDRLHSLSQRHCPDAVAQMKREVLTGRYQISPSAFSDMPRRQAMETLYATLSSFVSVTDPATEALEAETVFLQAKATLCDADLYTTACSALLVSPHKPKATFSIRMLCSDPLVLLKCPLKIWKRRGLRRVALSLLTSLLESNTAMVLNTALMSSSAEEFLAARNAVVVRCLLMFTCGNPESNIEPTFCAMTTSLIRSMSCGHTGLVASLIKQGLDEPMLDWLVENVPECMNDASDLLTLLSDRSSLTPAERLVAADAILRIAVVHGGEEGMAATMAYAALAQLVDSFFLVVGPVGVPVNALMIADDSGLDVTQISRKAAFRILRSLLRVTGRRVRLGTECGMALQKLANLCKSESTVAGVTGAVAGRRNSLLKELFDLIMKATTTMVSSSSTVGAQAVAA